VRNVAIHVVQFILPDLLTNCCFDFAPCFAGCLGTTVAVNRAAICIEMRTLPNHPLLTCRLNCTYKKQNARSCECFMSVRQLSVTGALFIVNAVTSVGPAHFANTALL